MALDFDLAEEQILTRQAVRDFAEREIAPIAQELDDKEEFSVEPTQKMAKTGLLGCCVPEKYGGAGVGYISYIIAVEELARIDGSQAATIAAANSLGVGPVYQFGNEEQKAEWLPKLCSGEMLAAFGLTEPEAMNSLVLAVSTSDIDSQPATNVRSNCPHLMRKYALMMASSGVLPPDSTLYPPFLCCPI